MAQAKTLRDVVAMVVTAGLFGLVPKDFLIDADVVVVAEVGFDDVIEFDAGGRPLGRRVRNRYRCQHRCQNDSPKPPVFA